MQGELVNGDPVLIRMNHFHVLALLLHWAIWNFDGKDVRRHQNQNIIVHGAWIVFVRHFRLNDVYFARYKIIARTFSKLNDSGLPNKLLSYG